SLVKLLIPPIRSRKEDIEFLHAILANRIEGSVTPCREKLRLVTEYHNATVAYSDSITAWVEGLETGTSRDHIDHLYALVEQSRLAAAGAREQLERHIGEHMC